MDSNEPLQIGSKATKLVQTRLSLSTAQHHYFEIKQKINALFPHLHVYLGIIESSQDQEIFL